MIQNFSNIIAEQRKLDNEIMNKFEKNYEITFKERKLALLVELSELANEIRSFKYWSVKPRGSDERILDEYADGLHFISGFAIQYSFNGIFQIKNKIPQTVNNSFLTKKMLKLFKLSSKINSKKHVIKFFKKYLEFGYFLGYSEKQIKDAYENKHEVNIQRQNTNY